MLERSEQYINEMLKPIRGKTLVSIEHTILQDQGKYRYFLENQVFDRYIPKELLNKSKYTMSYCSYNQYPVNNATILFDELGENEPTTPTTFVSNILSSDIETNLGSNSYPIDVSVGFESEFNREIDGVFIRFSKETDSFPKKISVKMYDDNNIIVYHKVFENEEYDFYINEKLSSVKLVVLDFLELNKPSSRFMISQLFLGNFINITENELDKSGFKYCRSVDPLSREISYTSLEYTVTNNGKLFDPFEVDGIYQKFREKQNIKLSIGREIDDNPKNVHWIEVANLLTESITFSEETYTVYCVDLLSSLTNVLHTNDYLPNAINQNIYRSAIDICDGYFFDTKKIVPTQYMLDNNMTAFNRNIPANESLQLLANHIAHIVYTNRDGQIEFKNGIVPRIVVTSNSELPYSDSNNLQNYNNPREYDYAQATYNYYSVKETNKINLLYEDNSNYEYVGYISTYISNDFGLFNDIPTITIEYEFEITIDKIRLVFDEIKNEYAINFLIEVFSKDGNLIFEKHITDNELVEFIENISIVDVKKIVISIYRWSVPYHRAIIGRIGSRDAQDYIITFDNMSKYPKIDETPVIKDIIVDIHSYSIDTETPVEEIGKFVINGISNNQYGTYIVFTDNEYWRVFAPPELITGDGVITNVYNGYTNCIIFKFASNTSTEVTLYGQVLKTYVSKYIENVNLYGDVLEIKNPLITTEEQAKLVSMWYNGVMKSGNILSFDYRGEPAIEPYDIIFIETQYKSKIAVLVLKNELIYGNGLKGKLEVIAI